MKCPPSPPYTVDGRAKQEELLLSQLVSRNFSGAIYEAVWQGAKVNVKVPNTNLRDVESWRAEVHALSVLRHPNIVSLLGIVAEPPTYCVIIEHVNGHDVRSALSAPTKPAFFFAVSTGTAAGMAYLHHKRLLHRDLKTENIIYGSAEVVKITNFGFSTRLLSDSDNATIIHSSTFRRSSAIQDFPSAISQMV